MWVSPTWAAICCREESPGSCLLEPEPWYRLHGITRSLRCSPGRLHRHTLVRTTRVSIKETLRATLGSVGGEPERRLDPGQEEQWDGSLCWCWGERLDSLLTHYSLSGLLTPPPHHPPPNPGELQWSLPPSPSRQLGVTDFKAPDMNNQTVIFSFSSSCYWPYFMIFFSPPLPSSLCPSCPPPLSSLSHLMCCRSLTCTRGSSRSRTRGTKPTQRTTTDPLQSSAGDNK